MPQAKVLNEKEIRRVLLHVATKKHAARNRAMFTVLNLTGMRVGELAALRLADVLTTEGDIREEVYLSAQMTKGARGRTVVLSDKAQEEIKSYLQVRFKLKDLVPVTFTDTSRALFSSQKHPDRGFTASTLAQHFHYMYKNAGIAGASSHSSRRGFLTALSNKGVSVRVLMELAGHSGPAVTMKYVDTNPQLLRASVNLL